MRLIEGLGKRAHATAPGRELVEAAQRIFRECNRADTVMRRFRELDRPRPWRHDADVNLPVEKRQLKITPLYPEVLVAIFPVGTRGVPDEVTPGYVARQNLLVEQATSAAHSLVLEWLSRHAPSPRAPTPLGTVEALKSAVASNLGMAIVPDVSVAIDMSDFIVRPLRPSLSRMLALIEHRNKPNEPALEIVRNALLALRTVGAIEPKTYKRRRNKPS